MKRVQKLACVLALALAPALAHADILINSSATATIDGMENYSESDDGSTSTATLQLPLTDSSNQIMQFSGTSTASAEYGGLHSTSMASITNNITEFNGSGTTGTPTAPPNLKIR